MNYGLPGFYLLIINVYTDYIFILF